MPLSVHYLRAYIHPSINPSIYPSIHPSIHTYIRYPCNTSGFTKPACSTCLTSAPDLQQVNKQVTFCYIIRVSTCNVIQSNQENCDYSYLEKNSFMKYRWKSSQTTIYIFLAIGAFHQVVQYIALERSFTFRENCSFTYYIVDLGKNRHLN